MKAFVILFALIALTLADHHEHHHGTDYTVRTKEDLLKYRDECVKELNVPAELVEKYKTWTYPDDEKTHCYMKCIFEKFDFFDAEHGFDVKKVHHQLAGHDVHVDHSDETHEKIEHCADKNTEGSDACAWAYRGGMCFIKNNLQLVQSSVKSH